MLVVDCVKVTRERQQWRHAVHTKGFRLFKQSVMRMKLGARELEAPRRASERPLPGAPEDPPTLSPP